MTLQEFFKIANKDDYVGLYNMDTPFDKKYKSRKRFEEFPTQQTYFKIKNIPYGRICNFLDYEISSICHTNKGYLIRIHSQRKLKEYANQDLAREIAREIKKS